MKILQFRFLIKAKNLSRQLSCFFLMIAFLTSCAQYDVSSKYLTNGLSKTSYLLNDKKLNHIALQSQIQKTIKKVYPATVGLTENDVFLKNNNKIIPEIVFSGVVVSAEGHILTAAHAIKPSKIYRVIFSDGTHRLAKGLGKIPEMDAAMVKITEKGTWPYAEMGWSSKLQVNQPCISIGYPGGYGALGRGAVVRFGRIADPSSFFYGFIQSTCLMEPGDSGGPLFDINGRVIGIHSNIDFNAEKNFEVAVNLFRRYWKELNIEKSFSLDDLSRTPDFGMSLRTQPEEINHSNVQAESFKKNETEFFEKQIAKSLLEKHAENQAKYLTELSKGVKINYVNKNGLAARSGLVEGDKIVAIDSEQAIDAIEINRMLYTAYLLDKRTVQVTVDHDGDKKILELAIPKQVDKTETPPQLKVKAIAELEYLNSHFSGVEARLDNNIAQVKSKVKGNVVESLATLLADDTNFSNDTSLLIGKSSLIGEESSIVFANSLPSRATVIARDFSNDLVLLKVNSKFRGGVSLNSNTNEKINFSNLGQFLISPDPLDQGKVSIISSSSFESPMIESVGFLGIEPSENNNELILKQVFPNAPASQANLKKNDIIVSADGIKVKSIKDLSNILRHYNPGDKISIKANRNNLNFVTTIILGNRISQTQHIADMLEYGKSKRRDGFKHVFAHDATLKPSQCGGALFNISGEFVGINIARYSRTQSFAIPASSVKKFVEETNKKLMYQ